MAELTIIGGGLAGSEAAWQAAQRGLDVKLYEMRPGNNTGAHLSANLAELVCSNSLGSNLIDRPSGLLKEETRLMDSMLLACAEASALPAGGALAVDRNKFSELVTAKISAHANIQIIQEELTEIPDTATIIASGPLTSPKLAEALSRLSGQENLFFFDAIAPIVTYESIDMAIAFRASRYGRGEQEAGDYINCPFNNKEQYEQFVEYLKNAGRIQLMEFETEIHQGVRAGLSDYFEGCLPVEVIAERGIDSLAYGPMRPVGLTDPHNGKHPHAVVQLRQDNLAGSLYNMVGFQTNLTYAEQKRVFQTIPGMEKAEFARYGQMHRNTFIASPRLIKPSLQYRGRPDLLFAGQITGVEGYMGNIATGLLAGINAARIIKGERALELPRTCMLGALCYYVTHAEMEDFQPMKANFGLLPPLTERIKDKRLRLSKYSQRAIQDLTNTLQNEGIAIGE